MYHRKNNYLSSIIIVFITREIIYRHKPPYTQTFSVLQMLKSRMCKQFNN